MTWRVGYRWVGGRDCGRDTLGSGCVLGASTLGSVVVLVGPTGSCFMIWLYSFELVVSNACKWGGRFLLL
jgi:hypothetical protein